nr:hypothetical protein [Streptomyces sp. SID5468]
MTFSGPPLLVLPSAGEPARCVDPDTTADLTGRMARHLNRAHTAVLDAHRAVLRWQTGHARGPATGPALPGTGEGGPA